MTPALVKWLAREALRPIAWFCFVVAICLTFQLSPVGFAYDGLDLEPMVKLKFCGIAAVCWYAWWRLR